MRLSAIRLARNDGLLARPTGCAVDRDRRGSSRRWSSLSERLSRLAYTAEAGRPHPGELNGQEGAIDEIVEPAAKVVFS
jgi:hypothetical protein